VERTASATHHHGLTRHAHDRSRHARRIQNGLQQVCNEMDLAFCRAAFSPVISETMDRSDGIYHRDSGELVAQGELGLPVFVGTMQFSTQAVIDRVRADGVALDEGDIFIVNDPYLGGPT
jgi:N-methylhydantoinase B